MALAGCSSDTAKNSPANRGPNSTVTDPGPNTTLRDPGPNPTDAALTTVSGLFTVVKQCARLELDGKLGLRSLQFPRNYTVAASGLTRDGTLLAAPGSRLFVTGRLLAKTGPCGTQFVVESLNSVQAPQ